MSDKLLFTKEELADLDKQALAEVEKELKAEGRKKLLAEKKKAARRKLLPAEALEIVQVTLPRFSNFVLIDGVRFGHGLTYEMPKSQADTVRDIMSCAWKHEDAAFGDIDPNAYRRETNRRVGPGMRFSESGHFSGGAFVRA